MSFPTGRAIRPPAADPRDILDKLAEFALGSPATCALRALARLCPELQIDDPALVGAAIVVALGFRSLYNQPESRALLEEVSPLNYWRQVNAHSAQHDLAAVLDEYLHLVLESERAEQVDAAERARLIAMKVVEVERRCRERASRVSDFAQTRPLPDCQL
ncbi:MAG: hypothetical protein IPI83_06735 [Sphingomonadales bacterium]|nr:hypothetical protein [Sphingomonadales bacterium]